ncbi:hypothetical protein EJ02DRAFT_416501 [Clathrospora elynae]|uniref:Uncharacterized protein n=1 Tax=Clathrospora elynae TaxID=706981 RepID=A0A6A5S2M8_9PLEO|nr:hypothetical protein EJ02DRAFT_416501 [Clathrospora elynae]
MTEEQDFDQIQLLAYLDALIRGSKQRSLQDKDQEEHMQDVLAKLAAKTNGKATAEDVRAQLWQLFRSRRRWPEHNFPLLFHHGSSELYLDRETTRFVEEQLSVIILQDALKDTQRSQRSRSAVPIPSAESARTTRLSKKKLEGVKKLPKGSFKKARLAARSSAERYRNHTSRSQSKQATTPLPTIEIDTIEAIDFAMTSSDGHSNLNCQMMSVMESQHGQTAAKSDSEATVEVTTTVATQNNIQPTQIATNNDCCNELVSELARYKNRWKEAELQCTILSDADRHLESMFARVRVEDANLLRELRKSAAEIVILKRKLADRMALEPYVLTVQDIDHSTIALQIRSLLTDLNDGVSSIPARTVAQRPLLHKLCEQSGDLKDLSSVVSGQTDHKDLDILSGLTLQELIQALTGAAIRHWIFESDFQIQSLLIGPLLQRYRDQIAALHGDQILFSLDRSVHRSLIEEHDFTDTTVWTMASKRCERLIRALRPLYGDQVRPKVIKQLRIRLESILQVAIRIRFLSLVSTEEYECIWPLPGSQFDSKEMVTQDARVAEGRTRVKAPIAPGLRAYPRKLGLVSNNGFETRGGRDAISGHVVQATVLI